MAAVASDDISAREAAVYDRQIRLWGVEAQRRMRSSVILFCGFRTLNAEICKNIVLAGVSVVIQDSALVETSDLGGNFFLNSDDVGKSAGAVTVQELNPFVSVTSMTKPVSELTPEDLKPITFVVMGDCPLADQTAVNKLCRAASVGFFATESMGWSASMFCDLGPEHTFLQKRVTDAVNADGDKEVAYEPSRASFCTLDEALRVDVPALAKLCRVRKRGAVGRIPAEAALEVLLALRVLVRLGRAAVSSEAQVSEALAAVFAEGNVDAAAAAKMVNAAAVVQAVGAVQRRTELSPVCAIMGGIVGQELIKAISGKDAPINNFFILDGITGGGMVRKVALAAP